ncbi:MAG: nitrate- and nitrite sensing domain-containing protein, partial [Bacteroidota bacterium]|nr:nitrate- and nitrite sensing domain-containing protein [Bacteroidota bacterium]
MNRFFRRLPLSLKLILVGIIPVIFLLYLSGQLYKEKRNKVLLIKGYIEQVQEANKIANLINELEAERKFSYQYALKKVGYGSMILQRTHTDGAIWSLKRSHDPNLNNFSQYTFLDSLPAIRKELDTSTVSIPATLILHYYTQVIFRLNTLNQAAATSSIYLQPVYQDMIAQKTLFKMMTYLGIMNMNVYNLLYTGQDRQEALTTTQEAFRIYDSYEAEFRLKASPASVKWYDNQKQKAPLKPVLGFVSQFLDSTSVDSVYSAEDWWTLSSQARDVLRTAQVNLWSK